MYCALRAVEPGEKLDPARLFAGGSATAGVVSLEKAWHGLHFLLTGSAMEGELPLNFLLLGGEPLDADESIRKLSPDSVREIQRTLAAISDAQLWSRFDPDQMSAEGVYPEIWDEPAADLKDEYLMYFHDLQALMAKAAAAGQAVLISIG